MKSEENQTSIENQQVFEQLKAINPEPGMAEQLFDKVSTKSDVAKRQLWTALGGAVVSLSALVWFIASGSMDVTGAVILAAWAAFATLYAGILLNRIKGFAKSQESLSLSFFDTWRLELKFKIKTIQWLGGVLLGESILLACAAVYKGIDSSAGLPIFLTFSGVFSAFVLHQFFMVLPRLKAELAQLNHEAH